MNKKIYFGTYIKKGIWLDKILLPYLIEYHNNIDKAVEIMLKELTSGIYYTFNPLIPNFCSDEEGSELFWIIDKEGTHIHFKEDLSLMKKLTMMGVGEALCDDARLLT